MHDFNSIFIPDPIWSPPKLVLQFLSQLGGSNSLLEWIHFSLRSLRQTPPPPSIHLMLFGPEESFPDIGYIDTKHMQALYTWLHFWQTNKMSAISSTYPHFFISKSTPSCQIFFSICIYIYISRPAISWVSPNQLFATLGYLSDAISTEEDRGSRDLHRFFVVKEENKLGDDIYNCVGFHFYFWAHPLFLRQPNLYPTVNPCLFLFCGLSQFPKLQL